jgi:hypothetical protein
VEISRLFDIHNDKEAKLQIILSLSTRMVSYIQELQGRTERTTLLGCGLVVLLDGWLVT